MDRLHLEVLDAVKDGKTRHVTRLTHDGGGNAIEIFHEFDRVMPWSDDVPLDGYVLVILLFAASIGKPLQVHGPISRSALRNMEELLLAWSRWKPMRYRRIDIVPDRVLDVRGSAGVGVAIAAFSGGMDATFTALRHAASCGSVSEVTRYGLRSGLMVHGFDVDVYNARDFERLVERTRPLFEALKLDLRIVRTNSRDLRLQDWDDSSALELAGCLHMHAGEFQYGLLGSTKSYDALVLPWGSNPVTDHLMSGDRLAVVHDGAGFSRTDKAAEILRNPVACRTVKVCYAGVDQSENCGRCEKCVRSQLNFLAAGAAKVPPCFPREFDLDCIRAIQIDHEAQMIEHASLLAYAKAHGVWGPWLPILEERLAKWRPVAAPLLARRKAGGPLKRTIAKSLTFLGVDEPAKKVWR
ncbi:MAG: hypothetical protein EPO08_15925, partial [Rhodospirillaceae bacterium]